MAEKKKSEKLDRTYVVPLRSGFRNTPRYARAKKAVSTLKLFLQKHMKTKSVKLGKNLNDFMWAKGIKNPPHHVKISVVKEDDVAKAELFGHKYTDFKVKEKKKEETLKDKLASKLEGKKPDADQEKQEKPKPEQEDAKAIPEE